MKKIILTLTILLSSSIALADANFLHVCSTMCVETNIHGEKVITPRIGIGKDKESAKAQIYNTCMSRHSSTRSILISIEKDTKGNIVYQEGVIIPDYMCVATKL